MSEKRKGALKQSLKSGDISERHRKQTDQIRKETKSRTMLMKRLRSLPSEEVDPNFEPSVDALVRTFCIFKVNNF